MDRTMCGIMLVTVMAAAVAGPVAFGLATEAGIDAAAVVGSETVVTGTGLGEEDEAAAASGDVSTVAATDAPTIVTRASSNVQDLAAREAFAGRLGGGQTGVEVWVDGEFYGEFDVYEPGRVVGQTTTSDNALYFDERLDNFLSNANRAQITRTLTLAKLTDSTAVFEFTRGVSNDLVWRITLEAEEIGVPVWIYGG